MQHKKDNSEKFIVFLVLDWIRDISRNIGISLLVFGILLGTGLGATQYVAPNLMRSFRCWLLGG